MPSRLSPPRLSPPRLSPWARKLLWFAGIYAASVIVVVAVAYGLRALLIP